MIFLFLSELDIAYQVEFMADIAKRDGTDLTSRSQLRFGRGDSHLGNTSWHLVKYGLWIKSKRSANSRLGGGFYNCVIPPN